MSAASGVARTSRTAPVIPVAMKHGPQFQPYEAPSFRTQTRSLTLLWPPGREHQTEGLSTVPSVNSEPP